MSKFSRPAEGPRGKTYKWHADWTVNVPAREAVHVSGLVVDFAPGWRGHLELPLGAVCASRKWRGALRGGAAGAQGLTAQRAARLCLEACIVFDAEAWDACMDCGVRTAATGDYYMVHDALWQKANPDSRGMLCLGCLAGRIGRKLQFRDFTQAPINELNAKVQRMAQEG